MGRSVLAGVAIGPEAESLQVTEGIPGAELRPCLVQRELKMGLGWKAIIKGCVAAL